MNLHTVKPAVKLVALVRKLASGYAVEHYAPTHTTITTTQPPIGLGAFRRRVSLVKVKTMAAALGHLKHHVETHVRIFAGRDAAPGASEIIGDVVEIYVVDREEGENA